MSYEAEFSPDHSDRLTVLELNTNGSKLLTAGIDHRLSIYNVNRSTSERTQLDVWSAHDAEIRDAKWFHVSTGTHFVTLGNDLQMRIWTEDVYQAPMSGRRFRKLATIKSEQLIPFTSVDVKTVGENTYIAVIDRQGLLSIYEPTRVDEFHDWSLIDQFYVHNPVPERSEHTSFRVQFDPNLFSLPYQNSLSDDAEQISLAVTGLSKFKVYRSTSDTQAVNALINSQQTAGVPGKGTNRLKLFEVAAGPSSTANSGTSSFLLRDLAWCSDNHMGRDIIATASIDGELRIYSMVVGTTSTTGPAKPRDSSIQAGRSLTQGLQSNPTTALHQSNSSPTSGTEINLRVNHPFIYSHTLTLLYEIPNAHIDAWSVRWDSQGEALLSSGSDGSVKVWKRHPAQTDIFELFAEQAGEEYDTDEHSDD